MQLFSIISATLLLQGSVSAGLAASEGRLRALGHHPPPVNGRGFSDPSFVSTYSRPARAAERDPTQAQALDRIREVVRAERNPAIAAAVTQALQRMPVAEASLALILERAVEESPAVEAAIADRDPVRVSELARELAEALSTEGHQTLTRALALSRAAARAAARAREQAATRANAAARSLAREQAPTGQRIAEFSIATPIDTELAAKGNKLARPVEGDHSNKISTLEIEAQDARCLICLEEYKDGANIGRLECGHHADLECLAGWIALKASCPVCRHSA